LTQPYRQVSLGQPATSIPIPVIVGIIAGSVTNEDNGFKTFSNKGNEGQQEQCPFATSSSPFGFMGLAFLKMDRSRVKWRIKLSQAFDESIHTVTGNAEEDALAKRRARSGKSIHLEESETHEEDDDRCK
jgi:hypothetical protein